MIISCIAALGPNHELGLNNKLLWHIKEDFKHFKKTTLNHTLVMGRKTFESIGKPLPQRKTIVLSHSKQKIEGVSLCHSVQEAVEHARHDGEEELFCAGGGEIYKQFLPISERLYLSYVDYNGPADTYFPLFDPSEWKLVKEVEHAKQEGQLAWTLRVFDRAVT